MDLVTSQGEPAGGAGDAWGSSAALTLASALTALSVGGAGPAPVFIPQTFIDADLMPGMMPRTRNAKMKEAHYLTSGSSWGTRTNCRRLWFSG